MNSMRSAKASASLPPMFIGEDASETTLKRTPLAVDAGRRGRCALKFSNCASQYFSSDRGSD
jgi:hypothetical protein